ncbi:hypothetical protein BASA61_000413 [Batrachochytrium salamandrivorans]|nr:hypothetical protein BASA61_000413 [Batrachochytrium salamandrivorans]
MWGLYDPQAILKVIFAIIFTSMSAGQVLTGLTVEEHFQGTTVAFVGRSGFGKSTVLVYWNAGTMSTADLHCMMIWMCVSGILAPSISNGTVGQEPILFNMSIKDNIGYGAINEFTDSNIIDAAKLANIHDFISALPKGYDTPVGGSNSLDAASTGRTTLVIAHRLSTIQDADKIFVVNGGKIVESGTHFELVDKRGEYYELVSQQMLSVDNL